MKKLFLAASVAAFSVGAQANDFQYSYGEFGLSLPTRSAADPVISLVGSIAVGESLFIRASYTSQDIGSSSYNWLEAGVGYHLPFPWADVPNLDAFGSVSLAHDEVDRRFSDDSSFGLDVRAGARWKVPGEWVSERGLETAGYVQLKSSNIVGQATFHAEARYYWSEPLSVAAGLSSGSVGDGLRISVRYGF